MKMPDADARFIDYRLNILGIRVWENACQLVAKTGDSTWSIIGHRWDLPVQIPMNSLEVKLASSDTVRLTAYQYVTDRPGSDLEAVLNQTKPFAEALKELPKHSA